MRELRILSKVKYIRDYILELTYTSGEKREIDFTNLLDHNKPKMRPLFEKSFFDKVALDMNGSLVWPNGWEANSDYLYDISQPLKKTA